MNKLFTAFEKQGFVVIENVIDVSRLQAILQLCEAEISSKAGTRNLLQHAVVEELSKYIARHPDVNRLLPKPHVAVQCTYFYKSEHTNWLVPLHRDPSIPVRKKFQASGWSGWSKKEGVHFVQPPDKVLQSMVAVRLHIDHTSAQNGALQVVPCSHKETYSNKRVTCEVPEGGALVMRPTLLHASSKLQSGIRRVLHFLYGPPTLPFPAEWAHAV